MSFCSWFLFGLLVRWFDMIAVFDLDGTVIDSSHRALTDSGGAINLENWRSHTAEQILQDSELPLARYMRECITNPKIRVWICTSRSLSEADRELLARLGLIPDLILSRDKNDNREDVPYKLAKIRKRLNLPSVRKSEKLFFDDRADIREAMRGEGFICPAPHLWNLYS